MASHEVPTLSEMALSSKTYSLFISSHVFSVMALATASLSSSGRPSVIPSMSRASARETPTPEKLMILSSPSSTTTFGGGGMIA